MSTRLERPIDITPKPRAQHKSVIDRPRTRTGFSLRNSQSRNSSRSVSRISFNESCDEKEAKRLQSKADPSLAIIEVEPSTVASDTCVTLAPLRSIQHRDKYGNLILEPDRSNPTRSRWERPLDTIRSFEAAIDGSYSRQSLSRKDLVANRRNSYNGNTSYFAPDDQARYRSNSYYCPSPSPSNYRIASDGVGLNTQSYSSRVRQLRPELYTNSHTIYSVPDVQEPYDLVNSASGSGSSVDPSYSTGPSSENSSIARIVSIPQKDSVESASGKGPPDETLKYHSNVLRNQSQIGNTEEPSQALPKIAMKEVPNVPIKLGGNSGISPTPLIVSQNRSEKRKSWLSKRLSRIL